MDFREFIESDEASLFEEGMARTDEWLGSALKFAAGAAGNAISQTARAVGNVGSGAVQGAYGIGQGALATAQRAGGGKEEADKTFRRARSNIGSGIGKVARGVAQGVGVATGITPVLRGAQAASEPIGITGVYSPGSGKRTPFQDLVGLDSWERKKPRPKAPAPSAAKPAPKKKADPASEFLGNLARQEKAQMRRVDPAAPKKQPEAWTRLVAAYKTARTKEERDEIRQKMRLVNPYLYQQAVEAGMRARAAKANVGRAV